jgi:peroxiredoxin family protein
MGEKPKKTTLIVFSGDMDKVFAAFLIATGAAAMGHEVVMFFTFWGLKAIQTGEFTGKSFFGRMLGLMNRGGINRIGPSRFNFGGIGRWMFKKMMNDKKVTSLSELLKLALELGVKLVPCGMSADIMGIEMGQLIEGVQPPAGVAAMLEDAVESQVQLFI